MSLKTWTARALLGAMPALAWGLFETSLNLLRNVEPDRVIEGGITAAAALMGAAVASYLTLTGLGLLLEAATAPRRRQSHPLSPFGQIRWTARLTPLTWRRVVATALGAGLVSGVAAPSLATTDPAPVGAGWVAPPSDRVVPVTESPANPPASESGRSWAPASESSGDTAGSAATDAPAATEAKAGDVQEESAALDATSIEARSAVVETYTVKRGDSLWRIAANHLSGDASDADISAAWPILYAANRDVIGDNPSLIYPGQVLVLPRELRP